MKLANERKIPEAKAKVKLRHQAGIERFRSWLSRQETTTRAERAEMFNFFIDKSKS